MNGAAHDGQQEGAQDAEIDEAAARAARSNPIAGEPVIQRVHVSPDNGPGSEQNGDEPSEKKNPTRRGWWQRQFGG